MRTGRRVTTLIAQRQLKTKARGHVLDQLWIAPSSPAPGVLLVLLLLVCSARFVEAVQMVSSQKQQGRPIKKQVWVTKMLQTDDSWVLQVGSGEAEPREQGMIPHARSSAPTGWKATFHKWKKFYWLLSGFIFCCFFFSQTTAILWFHQCFCIPTEFFP